MEPQTQYVRSADGTRIAVSTVGRGGPPLVVDSGIAWLTMETRWQVPAWRKGVEQLAEGRAVVGFDNRGFGLSDRDVQDFSLEARLADLRAVVSRLGTAIDLMGLIPAAQVAIAYAARHPEDVRRVILSNPVARGREWRPTALQRTLRPLLETDWPTYMRCLVLESFGWEIGPRVERLAIESTEPGTFIAAGRAAREFDVSDDLASVRCPTLILRSRSRSMLEGSLEAIKEVTEAIPTARLVQYSETTALILADETAVKIIEEFLDESESAPDETPALPSGTAIILFADIVDSTALTERLGDAAFRDKARDLDAALRAIIRERSGTPIEGKLLGDGVLATFSSAAQAIEAALACGRSGGDAGLPLHLGIHAGDVIREADPDGRGNVYGGAVNIAARIAAAAAAGETLVSATVRELARTSAGVTFEDRGEHSLKGIDDPVRVWAVRQA